MICECRLVEISGAPAVLIIGVYRSQIVLSEAVCSSRGPHGCRVSHVGAMRLGGGGSHAGARRLMNVDEHQSITARREEGTEERVDVGIYWNMLDIPPPPSFEGMRCGSDDLRGKGKGKRSRVESDLTKGFLMPSTLCTVVHVRFSPILRSMTHDININIIDFLGARQLNLDNY